MEANVFKGNTEENKGDMARLQSFVGAIAVGDMVKSTLGPKGMDKILQPMGQQGPSEQVQVTNDGATILKSTQLDNPAARILVEISKSQDDQVGDGTTTVAVFASELLKEAERLVNMKIHPQLVIEGQRMAKNECLRALEEISFEVDDKVLRTQLLNIARTTLSSKLLTQQKELFATIAVDAVLKLGGKTDLNLIKIIKKQGNALNDSFLADGLILEKAISVGCPKKKTNCKILVANTAMDMDKIKLYGAKVQTDSLVTLGQIEQAEKDKMRNKVEKILSYKPDVFVNRQLVQNQPEQLFAEQGVICIEHADFDGVERLSAVTGADILSTFNEPSGQGNKLGFCGSVEEIMIGEDKMIQFKNCKENGACTIVLRGSNTHILEEAERSIHDALCVLTQAIQNRRFIYGGGNSEIWCAHMVSVLATKVTGKKTLAIEAQANALKQLPLIVCENAGLDSSEIVTDLRSKLVNGDKTAGIDVNLGEVGDMDKMGIMECFKVKQTAFTSASEAAEQILRVDDIIKQAPRQRQE